jgi:DHA1 family bicyclomycin/chloramphenicol resistance-like MFS transporter
MPANRAPGTFESIALYACLTAITALSLDILLPAYSALGADLGVAAGVNLQHSLLLFVVGMLLGEFALWRYGRSLWATPGNGGECADILCRNADLFVGANLPVVLLGRLLQGMAAAGQKICTRAIIRDRYSGDAMARIMSYVLVTFVALPFIAPALGAVFTENFGWRSIFIFLGIYALVIFLWFCWRHPETLTQSSARNYSFFSTVQVFFRQKRSVLLTLTAGILFGVHLAFISLSPLLFADIYQVTDHFPRYFGSVVCAFGLALLINARLVMRFGMTALIVAGLVVLNVSQMLFLVVLLYSGAVPFWVFLIQLFLLLFALGLIFGNLTALILQPLGNFAGVGSALSSALSSAVALLVSFVMGFVYAGKLSQFVFPSVFAVLAATVVFIVSTRSQFVRENGKLVQYK